MFITIKKYAAGFITMLLPLVYCTDVSGQNSYSGAFLNDTLVVQSGTTTLLLYKFRNESRKPIRLSPIAKISSGGQLISKLPEKIVVSAYDSVIIPFKIYIQRNAKGKEQIRADLHLFTDTSLAESCYLQVEEVIRVFTNMVSYEVFFPPGADSTRFGIRLVNAGNTPQSVSVKLKVPQGIRTDTSGTYSIGINKDTVVYFNVRGTRSFNPDESYVISIFVKPESIKNTEHFYLHLSTLSSVKRFMKESDYKLNNLMRFNATGLLTGTEYYTLGGYGYKLVKQDKIYYRYTSYYFPETRTIFVRDLMLHYQANKFQLSAGDLSETFEKNIYGRGLGAGFYGKRSGIEFTALSNFYESFSGDRGLQKKYIYAGMVKYTTRWNDHLRSTTGVVQQIDKVVQTNSTLVASEWLYTIKNRHTLKMLAGASQEEHYNTTRLFYKRGAAFNAEYSAELNKISIRSWNYYSTPFYAATQRGLLMLNQQLIYRPFTYHTLGLQYQLKQNRTEMFFLAESLPVREQSSESIETYYIYLKNTMSVTLRPGLIRQMAFDPLIYQPAFRYRSLYERMLLEIQLRPSNRHTLLLSGEAGQIDPEGTDKPFYISQLKTNYTFHIAGLNLFYTYGPYYLYQQLLYLSNRRYEKDYTFSPFLSIPFFKDHLKLTLNGYYSYNSNYNMLRKGGSAELMLKLPGNVSLTSKADYLQLRNFERYEVRFGAEKRFGKITLIHSDIELFFFKDENSNDLWDKGEQVLDGIRVAIEGNNLISDTEGKILYKNLPKGIYKMLILESFGYYSKTGNTFSIIVNKNVKMAIPMTRGIQVKGKIVLEKDKHTKFGEVNLSGIRVTATDSNERSFYTLTDLEGTFTLFMPASLYKITLNRSAFGTDFECINPELMINLRDSAATGLRFVVKEKKRRVAIKKFNSSGQLLDSKGAVASANDTIYFIIHVQEGQTLYKITAKYKMSMEDLIDINHLENTDIEPGQALQVYRSYSADDVMEYVMKGRDTYASVAKDFDMEEEELIKLNKLSKPYLTPKQVIKVFKR